MNSNNSLSPGRRLLVSRLLVLVIGTLLSVSLSWFVREHQREQALFELTVVAQERTVALAEDSSHLSIALLSLQDLMSHVPNSDLARFTDTAQLFIRHYPEIRSLEWAPLADQKTLAQVATRAAQQQIQPYRIHNMNPGEAPLKSYDNGQFLPILYQVSKGYTPQEPGFDLMSVGLFRDEIRQATQENRPVSSRPFSGEGESGVNSLTRLFAPVFSQNDQSDLLGMISLVVDTRLFIETTTQSGRAKPVPFEVYDQDDHSKEPLYHWPATASFSASETGAGHSAQTIPFFDHQWRVIHVATEDYLKQFENFLPVFLLIIGMLFTLALYLVIRFAQTRTDSAFALNNEKFWRLEQANKLLNNKVIEKSAFERAHKDLQDRLADFLALSEGYFWELDQHYRFTFVSRRVMQVTGFPASSLLGARVTENLYEADANELKKRMEKAIPGKNTFTLEVRFLAQKHRWRWERLTVKPLFDEEGEFTGFRGVSHDISATKTQDADNNPFLTSQDLFHGENVQSGMSSQPAEETEHPFTERHIPTLALLRQGYTHENQETLVKAVGQLLIDARHLGYDQIAHEAESLIEAIVEEKNVAVHSHTEGLEAQLQSVLSKLIKVD